MVSMCRNRECFGKWPTAPAFLATYRVNGDGPDCTVPFLTSLCTDFDQLELVQPTAA